MSTDPRLYLVDGSGYIYRAYFAIPNLSTARGLPTNAVLGFTRMLLRLLKDERPDYVAVAFDSSREKVFRREIYPDYKATRPPPPGDLVPQFPYFREIVKGFNIPVLEAEGFEADDIIGTLVDRAPHWNLQPVVVSGDKDLMQLVDERTTMIDPMKSKTFGPSDVEEKFGVPPAMIPDVLGLAGDSSDNIPGVPGIGVKTGAKLLLTHGGSLEALLEVAHTIKGKRGQSLIEHRDNALMSKRLATINRDVPLSIDKAALKLTAPNGARLGDLFVEFEFHQLLGEIQDPTAAETKAPAADRAPASGQTDLFAQPKVETHYRTISTLGELDEVAAAATAAGRVAILPWLTDVDPMRGDLVGLSLSWETGHAAYVPLGHYYLGVGEQLGAGDVVERLRSLLEDAAVAKVSAPAKTTRIVLRRFGVELAGLADDPKLTSYLIDPERRNHGVAHLASELFNHALASLKEITGGSKLATFADVPIEAAAEHAGEYADYGLRVANKLRGMADDAGFGSLLDDLELPLSKVLSDMEMLGMLIDPGVLGELSVEFTERIAELEASIYDAAGKPFTIGSPKQLAEVLYDDLELPVRKKTKTGRSTDHQVLEELAAMHPLPRMVVDWRHLSKLKSTYVDALPGTIHADTGRVHPSYKQAVAATGRLSCDSPNLQNIPIRTDEGKRIRTAFIAPPNQVLLSADYSQIELRVLAHLSCDPSLLSSFRKGEDIHRRTASEIFNVFPELVSSHQRTAAKAINFGIMYGMSAFRLSRDLQIPRKQAQTYIDTYFERYTSIKRLIDRTLADARARGYVRTLFGRRRFLTDLNSRNYAARGRAEREAVNSPCQGTAADILKMAMVEVQEQIHAGKIDARLVLTVHDELLFEVAEDHVLEVASQVKSVMEGVVELAVPLVVETHWGHNWAETK